MKKCLRWFCTTPNPKKIQPEHIAYIERDDIRLDRFLDNYRNPKDAKLLYKPIFGTKVSFLDIMMQKMILHIVSDGQKNMTFTDPRSEVNKYLYGFYRVLDCLKDNVSEKSLNMKIYYSVLRAKSKIFDPVNKIHLSPDLFYNGEHKLEESCKVAWDLACAPREYNPIAYLYIIRSPDNEETYVFKAYIEELLHHTPSPEASGTPDVIIHVDDPAVSLEDRAMLVPSPAPSGGYGFGAGSSRGSPANEELREFATSPFAAGLRWRGNKDPVAAKRSMSVPAKDFQLTSSPLGAVDLAYVRNPAFEWTEASGGGGFAPIRARSAAYEGPYNDRELETPLLGFDKAEGEGF